MKKYVYWQQHVVPAHPPPHLHLLEFLSELKDLIRMRLLHLGDLLAVLLVELLCLSLVLLYYTVAGVIVDLGVVLDVAGTHRKPESRSTRMAAMMN